VLTNKHTAEIGNTQLDARDGYHDALRGAVALMERTLYCTARLPRCDAVYYDANGFERTAS